MSIEQAILTIKRQDSALARFLYRTAKACRSFHLPGPRFLFKLLYYERLARLNVWHHLMRFLYYEPMFRARCDHVGRRLTLIGGIPQIAGHLKVFVGDDVTMHGVTSFVTTKAADDPVLEIGDGTYVGYQVTVSAGKRVTIGKHCLIADRVLIADHDGHPLDYDRRVAGCPVDTEDIHPVVLEDGVWVGSRAVILKGVTIGRGAVIGANSVVTKDVPPFTLAAGCPARVIRSLDGRNGNGGAKT
ncbi:MAG: acyltransferase [Planctomycetes bacterium]|nr:acyltransferase [Planctomycetota bacterium]